MLLLVGLTLSVGSKFCLTELCKSAKMDGTFFVRNATLMFVCGSMA